MATMCPEFEKDVLKVIEEHTAPVHCFNGGNGVCCYVWVAGPGVTPKGNKSVYIVRKCFSSNCLDLTGTFDRKLKATEGYHSHYVNFD